MFDFEFLNLDRPQDLDTSGLNLVEALQSMSTFPRIANKGYPMLDSIFVA